MVEQVSDGSLVQFFGAKTLQKVSVNCRGELPASQTDSCVLIIFIIIIIAVVVVTTIFVSADDKLIKYEVMILICTVAK